ncbi:MAG: hypothetical protein IM551_06690 [Chitinophagaceae bacterium]|nr:hypothetical protein [Chitinophagaceae bacterium]
MTTREHNEKVLGKMLYDLGIAEAFDLNSETPITTTNNNLKEFIGFLLNAGDDRTFTAPNRFQFREIGEDAVQHMSL